MVFKLSLDYKRTAKAEEEVSNAELTVDYINYAVKTKHKEGLNGSMRRMWGRIQRKFDAAIENEEKSVDLEDSELDFVFEAFKDTKYDTSIAKYVDVLEDYLQSKREPEKKDEGSKKGKK